LLLIRARQGAGGPRFFPRARGAKSVVPSPEMAGYPGTPLPKKLGIKDAQTVALVGAPDGFEAAR
jgi:hypothetical protein